MFQTVARLYRRLPNASQQHAVTAIRNESYRLARADLATRALAALEESRTAPDPLAELELRLTALLGSRTEMRAAA